MEFPLEQSRLYSDTEPNATATIRQQNDFFQVDEILGFDLAGEGEHLYLHIRKSGQNTNWVKQQLAEKLGMQVRDIGHAGLKDRHAVTTQWLSLYTPKAEPELEALNIEGVELLGWKRHKQKLKPGLHQGNQFKVRLSDFQGDDSKTENILESVRQFGFPNYFGLQRFGHGGGNLSSGWQLLQRRRLGRHKKKSIYLSSLRSFLFNQVLDTQIRHLKDSAEHPAEKLSDWLDISGPLWGRGNPIVDRTQAEAERQALKPWHALCDALEFSGLQQERRPLFIQPVNLTWSWPEPDQLDICFGLPSGAYATSLLNELARVSDASVPALCTEKNQSISSESGQ